MANTKVEYNRVHGSIEVTHTHNEIPLDYRRRQTLKNAERLLSRGTQGF